jgi:hypothetical protein
MQRHRQGTQRKNTNDKNNTSGKNDLYDKRRGKWSRNRRLEIFTKKLTKNILEKTYDSSAIAFIILKGIGSGPLKAFLKPTYYIDDPAEFLGEIEMFKQQRLEQRKFRQTINRLQGYGLVKKDENNFSLTILGEKVAEKILGYKKRLEEEWDGKYRLVIFDIPEEDKKHRDWLRQELYFLGYEKLQNSVFVSKLSLTEELIKEIKERGIEEGVNYLLVEHIYDLGKGDIESGKE